MCKTNRTKQIAAAVILFIAVAFNFAGCEKFGADSTVSADSKTKTAGAANSEKKPTSTNSVQEPAANEVQIVIENFAFVPSELTIAPGTRVTWINKDEAPHTATSTDKKFNSGGLDTDDKWSFVFNDKGEFPYFCALHPHMTATITVK